MKLRLISLLVFVSLSVYAHTYYVNDVSTNMDLWCTQPSNITNTGLSADSPLPSLQSVLSKYSIASNDIVRIDAGVYEVDETITLDLAG